MVSQNKGTIAKCDYKSEMLFKTPYYSKEVYGVFALSFKNKFFKLIHYYATNERPTLILRDNIKLCTEAAIIKFHFMS